MRIDHAWINTVTDGSTLEPKGYSARANRAFSFARKQQCAMVTLWPPVRRLPTEHFGYPDPAKLLTFGNYVHIAVEGMFNPKLPQLAHAGTRTAKVTNNEVPEPVIVALQTVSQLRILLIADNVIEEGLLLDLYSF